MSYKIGIIGCSYNSLNMGCVALHHSLLLFLEEIRKSSNSDYSYYIFDFNGDSISVDKISDELKISKERLFYGNMPYETSSTSIKSILKKIKYYPQNKKAYSTIRKCNVVIDLTQGDSFSDIYGKDRFYQWTKVKDKIEKMGIPLILGPQTYGPFVDSGVRAYSKKVIERASLVISRDDDSRKHVLEFCEQQIIAGTDLAFKLPYSKTTHQNEIIRVGINPSGLLGNKKNDLSSLQEELSVEYNAYIRDLISWLLSQKRYEVHLIPHVGNEALECFGGIEGVIYHNAFNNPIEAKSLISTMNIFVGARMHATIAALSSGVATIPTAYSMKFSGVFKGIGYPYVIDMRELSTEQALSQTITYICNYPQLEKDVRLANEKMEQRYLDMKEALSTFINNN